MACAIKRDVKITEVQTWATTFPSLHKRPTRQPIHKCTALCRSDDCILYTPIRTQNDSSLLQNDLLKLQKWQDTWLLKFNPDKCYTMTLATRTPTSNMYTFCGQTLTSVNSHCYLGIHLSNTLNWTNQTKVASTKAQQTLGVIRRNLNKCPTHIKAVAYTSLVRPILEYASAAWDLHSQNNINTLERIQRQAARFCKNNYSREPGSVTKLLQELGWETLQARRKHKRITTLYKMEHNIIDIPLSSTILVAHVNITASFFKLDIRPTLSEKVFSQLLLKNGMLYHQTLFQAAQ